MNIQMDRKQLTLYIPLGLIVSILSYLALQQDDQFYIDVGGAIGYKRLLILLMLLTFACICLLINNLWFSSKSKARLPKLKLIYGIYFDKIGNPYCPVCKTPITIRIPFIGGCPKCNKDHTPRNENGSSVTYISIKNNIKSLWNK